MGSEMWMRDSFRGAGLAVPDGECCVRKESFGFVGLVIAGTRLGSEGFRGGLLRGAKPATLLSAAWAFALRIAAAGPLGGAGVGLFLIHSLRCRRLDSCALCAFHS